MLDNQGNLAEIADYTLASAHTTVGGEYKSMLELLDTEVDMVTALSKYCLEGRKYWGEMGLSPVDILLTRLDKLSAVYSAISEIAKELTSTYNRYGPAYDKALKATYKYNKKYPY